MSLPSQSSANKTHKDWTKNWHLVDREFLAGKFAWPRILENDTAFHLLLGLRLNPVVDWLKKKKKSLQFFKYFAVCLYQPLRDGVFFPIRWIWVVFWLGLAGRMGQRRWYVSSKPKVLHTSTPLLLFCLRCENNTELTCWERGHCGAGLSRHPSWGHPRSAISSRLSNWWQTHEQAQLTSREPISDQHSCSASPEMHEKQYVVVILSH